jgi:lipoprotein-anchoring transpeptidase ErfK/SrfK
MPIKSFIALITCYFLFAPLSVFAWSEEPEESDLSTANEYYYGSDDRNSSDNMMSDNNYIQEIEPQESRPPTYVKTRRAATTSYASDSGRLPKQIETGGEKVIVIDPHVHAWGAYNANGQLIRSGLATAGARWCEDIGRPCRTKTGVFRIASLGDRHCVSNKFPLGEGGAPMPYCMYFNGGQAIHGSNQLAAANLSHGCVRISVQEAQWLRFDFARTGTKVIVKPY